MLNLADMPTELREQGLEAERATQVNLVEIGPDGALPSLKNLADLERDAILNAIRMLHGDKLAAARLLGIGKTTLYRKLKEYGIADPLREC
jgi:two-component system response regulator HydG